ncbi:5-bromo-4-chloroindolyl phosphate hydrolysis family protein [Sulfitobacter aestuariivivens]|uniref:5-bromo-4-chloroindolyl phosphate hydrolysis family protein n=1 Tax=Sulfitobacter aestuariivivens TaxID=2766981 RepID=A0A927D098_9RHOB|nr:5-bromo-4-chloroindolyl phosphate hydrolysis family protein [Sulfitobacter aestuariivivens]MBD3662644.1 5-bromo-4-chloroindolyl phosphate hydrolysis family protein [Sulfitobacter aestuariivivens]
MAKRFGGKYSPDTDAGPQTSHLERVEVDPVGGRANVLFIPAVVLVATSFSGGALGLTAGLIGAGVWTLAAWMLREGLQAEAEYHARKVARRPAVPRKILSSALTGIGTVFAVLAHLNSFADILAPLLFGLCAAGLHVAAFGIDPLKSKGMEGIDTFQQDRVARVVDEAEKHLAAMSDAIRRANDRRAAEGLGKFQQTARTLIRTVEEDPRDLTAARKYLGVYLRGARDATVKFADIYSRTQDVQARDDYLALLKDLDQNFAARTRKSLLDDRGDLTVEIEVLRERLSREGVRLD